MLTPTASTSQLATTAISCSTTGVNATITFIDLAGRVLGLNVAALGITSLQSVLADPLTSQYNLKLVNMVAHRLSERAGGAPWRFSWYLSVVG